MEPIRVRTEKDSSIRLISAEKSIKLEVFIPGGSVRTYMSPQTAKELSKALNCFIEGGKHEHNNNQV